MIDDFLQSQAADYISGAMTGQERDQFELLLEFHAELRDFANGLAEIGALLTLSTLAPSESPPPPALKARILNLVAARPQSAAAEGLVMSGLDGLVQWVNPAFTSMCGYTLEELRGKKLGPILQGEKTDRETAERMRRAVHECRPCNEIILNYHKNGAPYWVEIAITPVPGEGGQPQYLVARERELAGLAAG